MRSVERTALMPRSNGNLLPFPEGTTLRACGPDGVAELKKFWREADVRRHTLIVAEDDIDDDVFFILAGHARAAFAGHI